MQKASGTHADANAQKAVKHAPQGCQLQGRVPLTAWGHHSSCWVCRRKSLTTRACVGARPGRQVQVGRGKELRGQARGRDGQVVLGQAHDQEEERRRQHLQRQRRAAAQAAQRPPAARLRIGQIMLSCPWPCRGVRVDSYALHAEAC